MWTREELKSRAKGVLRDSYSTCFIVCLIVSLISGSIGFERIQNHVEFSIHQDGLTEGMVNLFGINLYEKISDLLQMSSFAIVISLVAVVIAICMMFFDIFFIGPLKVGQARFFLKNREEKASIGMLFSVFGDRNYFHIVKVILLKDIKIFLWSLCFIIPGICKSYEYYMVPWILAEDSSLSSEEVFYRTRVMTDHMKLDIFILELSFIGWWLLGSLLFNIGQFFVTPYVLAVDAELYLACKNGATVYGEFYEDEAF